MGIHGKGFVGINLKAEVRNSTHRKKTMFHLLQSCWCVLPALEIVNEILKKESAVDHDGKWMDLVNSYGKNLQKKSGQ